MMTVSFYRRLPAIAAAGFMLFAGAGAVQAQQSKEDIEKIVREYLLKNPEIIQEAIMELRKKQELAEKTARTQALQTYKKEIFESKRDIVLGNPNGDVTLVEFFDYNCGYCKRALNDIAELLKSDPKLRVVLKELPILSEGSEEAARVAVAVRMQDPKKYFEFHQKLLGGRGQADKARAIAVAKEVGLDTARIEKDMNSDEVKATLEESMKLAEPLGLNGTPSYVIGSDIVVGAVGHDALKGKINQARCGKATC
jgi:protein-disulfide isomerase